MHDLLLELRSEEIPARMQDGARAELSRRLSAELAKAGLAAASIETYATPRRLALIARGLPAETASVSEEIKGPRATAPPQALEGFLRKTGLSREALVERDGVLFAVIDKPGRATLDVLAEAIPAVVRGFAWPKSMRWGAASISTESLRWVRPLQSIVALFDGEIVSCAVDGIEAGAESVGHRFHHPGPITFAGAEDYAAKLRACHVIVDQDERAAIIRDGAAALAADAGLAVIADEALVAENAGLTEWPVPLLGRFDPAFLEVPPEVIRLTMRTNQKYFALAQPPSVSLRSPPPPEGEELSAATSPPLGETARSAGGDLAPAFIATANIVAHDGGAKIVRGNEKVLAARLADARFFWEQDLRVSLEAHGERLKDIVFHEKLGTVADKVERVAKLARWLCEEGVVHEKPLPFRGGVGVGEVPSLTDVANSSEDSPHPNPSPEGEGLDLATLAERAARLCKADLTTAMVGEFPELQGIIGGYYAAKQGEHPLVAAAIRDHYKPVGQGDDVPTDPITVAVSLADKLDTLLQFFWINELPSGSRDPFALRRAALGALRMMEAAQTRISIWQLTKESLAETAADEQVAEVISEVKGVFDHLPPRLGTLKRADLLQQAIEGLPTSTAVQFIERIRKIDAVAERLTGFLADRLKVQQREAGVRHDLIDAVFALGGEDDLVRLLARVRALQAFVETGEGANLLAGYKRAANILKKEGYTQPVHPERSRGTRSSEAENGAGEEEGGLGSARPSPSTSLGKADVESIGIQLSSDGIPQTGEEDPLSLVEQLPDLTAAAKKPLSYSPELAETALIAALDSAEPLAREAIERENFEGAMRALASLRAPIDAFFDEVTVNDSDPAKRDARLALLARVRDAVHSVADFSKIEG